MVESNDKKGVEKGVVCHGSDDKLTKREQQIYTLFLKGFIKKDIMRISSINSDSTFYKHRKNIIKKGYSLRPKMDGVKKRHHSLHHKERFRLHGEQITIKIIWKDELKYQKEREKSNIRFYYDNRIELNRHNIEIYSNKDLSFFGKSVEDCDKKSMSYWLKVINLLENDLGLVLLKSRKNNICRVAGHIADVNNKLAEKTLKEDNIIKVYGSDSKVWMIADASWGSVELECIHPREHKTDMKRVIDPFFNDLREHYENSDESMTMSGLLNLIKEQRKEMKEIKETLKGTIGIQRLIMEDIRILVGNNKISKMKEDTKPEIARYIG